MYFDALGTIINNRNWTYLLIFTLKAQVHRHILFEKTSSAIYATVKILLTQDISVQFFHTMYNKYQVDSPRSTQTHTNSSRSPKLKPLDTRLLLKLPLFIQNMSISLPCKELGQLDLEDHNSFSLNIDKSLATKYLKHNK